MFIRICFKSLFLLGHLLLVSLIAAPFIAKAQAEAVAPMLKSSVTVHADIVTFGDLFDHAGLHSEKSVFYAPPLGTSGQVSVNAIQKSLERLDINSVDFAGLQDITIKRPAIQLEQDVFDEIIKEALLNKTGSVERLLNINIDSYPESVLAPANVKTPVSLKHLNYSDATNRFTAHLSVSNNSTDIVITGRAVQMAEALTVTSHKSAGDIIRNRDLKIMQVPENRLPYNGYITDRSQLIGKAVSRHLRAGSFIQTSDIQDPILINRNDIVTVVFQSGQLSLTVLGRALDEGAKGETIRILNLQSKRTIAASVLKAGTVSVSFNPFELASLTGAK
jgi:flagella basal body P-ring formation protein FlgA